MRYNLHCYLSPLLEDAGYFNVDNWKFWSDFLLDYWHNRCVPNGISYMFLNKYFYIE